MSTLLLSRGTWVRFRAVGQSMWPVIRDGEVITVAPIAPCDVKRCDILLCRTARGLLAHRVVGIQRGKGQTLVLTTRGDALGTCDAPVQAGQILGKVMWVQRGGRIIDVASWRARRWHPIGTRASRLTGRIAAQLFFLRRS